MKRVMILLAVILIVVASGCIGGGHKATTTNTPFTAELTGNSYTAKGVGKASVIVPVRVNKEVTKVVVSSSLPGVKASGELVGQTKNMVASIRLTFSTDQPVDSVVPVSVTLYASDGEEYTLSIPVHVQITLPKFGRFIYTVKSLNLTESDEITLKFEPYDALKYKIVSVSVKPLENWVGASARVSDYNINIKLWAKEKPPSSYGVLHVNVYVIVAYDGYTKKYSLPLTYAYSWSGKAVVSQTSGGGYLFKFKNPLTGEESIMSYKSFLEFVNEVLNKTGGVLITYADVRPPEQPLDTYYIFPHIAIGEPSQTPLKATPDTLGEIISLASSNNIEKFYLVLTSEGGQRSVLVVVYRVEQSTTNTTAGKTVVNATLYSSGEDYYTYVSGGDYSPSCSIITPSGVSIDKVVNVSGGYYAVSLSGNVVPKNITVSCPGKTVVLNFTKVVNVSGKVITSGVKISAVYKGLAERGVKALLLSGDDNKVKGVLYALATEYLRNGGKKYVIAPRVFLPYNSSLPDVLSGKLYVPAFSVIKDVALKKVATVITPDGVVLAEYVGEEVNITHSPMGDVAGFLVVDTPFGKYAERFVLDPFSVYNNPYPLDPDRIPFITTLYGAMINNTSFTGYGQTVGGGNYTIVLDKVVSGDGVGVERVKLNNTESILDYLVGKEGIYYLSALKGDFVVGSLILPEYYFGNFTVSGYAYNGKWVGKFVLTQNGLIFSPATGGEPYSLPKPLSIPAWLENYTAYSYSNKLELVSPAPKTVSKVFAIIAGGRTTVSFEYLNFVNTVVLSVDTVPGASSLRITYTDGSSQTVNLSGLGNEYFKLFSLDNGVSGPLNTYLSVLIS